jgi:hypothetical protein
VHAWITHRPGGSAGEPPTRQARVAITDHGRWTPERRTTDPRGFRGHGLPVMNGVMAEVHLQHRGGGGTTVVLVSPPVAAAAPRDRRGSEPAADTPRGARRSAPTPVRRALPERGIATTLTG